MTVSSSPISLDILAEVSDVFGDPQSTPQHPALSVEPDLSAAKIMIIDDEILNIKLARKYLQDAGYETFVPLTDPCEASSLINLERPDVVLLDVMMPKVSGLEILDWIRNESNDPHLPVIILTASSDRDTKLEALELGATDFLTKPIDAADMVPRVRNACVVKKYHDHLRNYSENLEAAVRKRTADLERSRLEVVHCLARASEFRDDVTGQHVYRVGRYAYAIACELGIPESQARLLELAAQLHDVGKIGVPDSILKKEDKLTTEEIQLMRKHCGWGKKVFDHIEERQWKLFREHPQIGKQLLDAESSPLIQLAARVAMTHHERWDGKGYPLGLSGEDIPLEGRITAVADVFDALRSQRPYKSGFSMSDCLTIMEEGRGTQFDPNVLDAFLRCKDQINEIQIELADTD